MVYTARAEVTALARLATAGSDESAAAEVTVLNLLNHISGLDWRVDVYRRTGASNSTRPWATRHIRDSGEGDDALAREVAAHSGSTRIAPSGTRFSYSQAGYDLLGRVIGVSDPALLATQ